MSIGSQDPKEFMAQLAKALGQDVTIFSKEEAEALKVLAEMQSKSPNAIKFWVLTYEFGQTLGKAGTTFQGIVKWFVYFGALIMALKAGVLQWLATSLKGMMQ